MKAQGIAGRTAALGLLVLASSAASADSPSRPVASATFRSYDGRGCVVSDVTVFVVGGPNGVGGAKLDLVASRVDECQGKDLLATKASVALGAGAFSVSPDLGTATLVAAVKVPGRAGRDAAVNVNLTWTATEPAIEADTSVSPESLGRWSRAAVHRTLRMARAAGIVSDGVTNLIPVLATDAMISLTQARGAGGKG
jgi:hypothetical protein